MAVVGIGMVGTEMLKLLHERRFPAKSLRVFATRERDELIAGKTYHVEVATEESFQDMDIAIFAGTEGAKGASQTYGWKAVEQGTVVIDNGDDYRMDPRVPLVIPEVNANHLKQHQGFISNPNCSTIQMVMVLGPLHRAAGLKRVVVSTYQAVSGTGKAAVEELREQAPKALEGQACEAKVYPHTIAFNCIPQVSSLKNEFPGYYGEEIKMIQEPRKILEIPNLPVSATCVRVPVFNAHSESINVELHDKLTAEQARKILSESPGIQVLDDPARSIYPTPREVSGKDPVYVGRIREDSSVQYGLDLWVVSDNIRKGAALNTIQIAERMIEMELL